MYKKILISIFILCYGPFNGMFAHEQQLQKYGLRSNLTPNTEIKIITRINPYSENYSFPIVAFESHNYIRLTFIFACSPISSKIIMISPNAVNSVQLEQQINQSTDSIKFRLLIHDQNNITVFIQNQSFVFHGINIDENIPYDIYIPEKNSLIISSDVFVLNPQSPKISLEAIFWIIAIFIIDILIFFYLKIKNAKEKKMHNNDLTISNANVIYAKNDDPFAKGSIRLFGEFKIFDKNGTDITKNFSPMLQELFCLILCHYPEGGISAASLKYYLWYDKDNNSARNNRSVYLAKLKKILDNVGNCTISKNGEFILFESENINIDYYNFIDIIKSNDMEPSKIESLINIINKGVFLYHCEYTWCETIKSKVSDTAIGYLEKFLLSYNIKDNPELVINACSALFAFDSLDEIALRYKCRAYKEVGNHTLSKQLYTNFIKEYSQLYGEDFNKPFSEIMTE